MTEELAQAQGLLASGDIPGLLRHLRAHGEALPLDQVTRLVAAAARLAGFDDLAQAAAAVADGGDGSGTQNPRALYGFGYACLERGPATWRSGRWPAPWNWRRTPRRCSAS